MLSSSLELLAGTAVVRAGAGVVIFVIYNPLLGEGGGRKRGMVGGCDNDNDNDNDDEKSGGSGGRVIGRGNSD